MRESGKMIRYKVMECILVLRESNMMGNGLKIRDVE